jgi:tRNA (cytidine/uridine-2'-O-)-methyltransferase
VRSQLELAEPHFNVVLVRPEIPQNTGSIARLTAATRVRLHLVGPLGFSLADRYLKRAGLDYWPYVDFVTYEGWDEFSAAHGAVDPWHFKYFSVHTEPAYHRATYRNGDFLVFGSETKGLGAAFLEARREYAYRIPQFEPGVRSLNLANAVSIVLYEGLRQTGRLESA